MKVVDILLKHDLHELWRAGLCSARHILMRDAWLYKQQRIKAGSSKPSKETCDKFGVKTHTMNKILREANREL